MTAVDKGKLLKARTGEGTYDVDGVGTVRFRGLSRQDVLDLAATDMPEGPGVFERYLLAAVMVDPVLTVDDVEVWQGSAPAGELEAVVAEVNRLSGLTRESAKDAYKEFDADPAAEFRVLPRPRAGDDGGAAAG